MKLTAVFLFLLSLQAHFEQDNSFDFQKYIRRALDKDFGVVVGIRLWKLIFNDQYNSLNPKFVNFFA